MNIIHFADYHLGVDTIGPVDKATGTNGRVLDYLDMLDSLIDYAADNKADAIVFAGDAFHRHNPVPTYLVMLAERIIRASHICPVVLLVGNHDLPNSADRASAIDVFQAFASNNVYVGNKYEVLNVKTKSGILQVACFPYPFKSRVLTGKQLQQDAQDIKKALQEFCHTTLIELGSNINPEHPAVLLGHFSVDKAQFSTERMYIAGADAEVMLEDLVQEPYYPFDYVALGHIHLHQCLNVMPPVVYSGSLERVDFTEENDRRGFIWVSISDEEVNWEFVDVDARPYKTFRFDFTDKLPRNVTEKIVAKLSASSAVKGAVVRVIIKIGEDYADSIYIEQISEALSTAFTVRGIQIERVRSGRDDPGRLEAVTGKPVYQLSPGELLAAYFEIIEEKPVRTKNLLKLAADIMEEANER